LVAADGDARTQDRRLKWLQLAVAVGTVLGTALAFFLIPEVQSATEAALGGDTDRLREELKDAGAAGVALLVGLVLTHAVLPYPHEILSAAAGFVYGFALAAPVMAISWAACAVLSYWVAEALGRPAVVKLAGEVRVQRLEAMVERGGVPALLLGRIIPLVPFNLFCYVCGIVRVPLWRYTWTSFVGFTPFTLLLVYLGATLGTEGLTTELLLAMAGLCAVSVAGWVLLRRRVRA
jgi:uncharacterized membrane protein YdjX (TVP38/TMEM64 family)